MCELTKTTTVHIVEKLTLANVLLCAYRDLLLANDNSLLYINRYLHYLKKYLKNGKFILHKFSIKVFTAVDRRLCKTSTFE